MAGNTVCLANITLFRLADYADKKVRRLAERARQRKKQAALSIAHYISSIPLSLQV